MHTISHLEYNTKFEDGMITIQIRKVELRHISISSCKDHM